MKLIDIIRDLDNIEDNLIIYAERNSDWNKESEVLLLENGKESKLLSQSTTIEYFLEVNLAKEVLNVLQDWNKHKVLTLEDKYKAILYYAVNDAYILL